MEKELTKMTLKDMRDIDIRDIDRDSLVDINNIKIDPRLPREQRMMDFIRQIGNPYCYRCGKAVVKVSFANTDVTLEDRLEHYLQTL